MTPFEIEQRNQELSDRHDATNRDRYIDGNTDATTGASPASNDEAYLSGYLAGLKAVILQGTYTLQIRWLSQAFISGGYDAEF